MNRQATTGILAIAACGLVMWVFRSGMNRAPEPGPGGNVSATVLAAPKTPKSTTLAPEDPEANGYGSISGQVVLEGEFPNLPPLVRSGDDRLKSEDRATCAREDIPDESLSVDEKSRGIANVFVYLPKATNGIHPKLQQSQERQVVGSINGCRFLPHALIARTDQVIVVRALDDVPHNVHERPIRTTRFGGTIKPLNDQREMKFEYVRAEPSPFRVACDFHPWMRAWWLVLDHPYAAISDAEGRFTITDLPAGDYEFRVWHEKLGDIHQALKVSVKADQATVLDEIRVLAADGMP